MTFSRMTYEPVFPEQAELYSLMHKTMYIMPPTSVYKMLHIFLYFCMEMYFLYFCLMFSYVKYMIYKSIKNYNSIGKLVVFIKGASQSIFILSLHFSHPLYNIIITKSLKLLLGFMFQYKQHSLVAMTQKTT